MSVKRVIGGEEFELRPVPPKTDEDVIKLLDSGDFVLEVYPNRHLRAKGSDEVCGEHKRVTKQAAADHST